MSQTLEKPTAIVTEQKQKQRLTFEQICPEWNKAITEKKRINPSLNINKYDSCIVGEAHGFGANATTMKDIIQYNGCTQCGGYSRAFAEYVTQIKEDYHYKFENSKYVKERLHNVLYVYKDFDRLKESFVNHWNEKHI